MLAHCLGAALGPKLKAPPWPAPQQARGQALTSLRPASKIATMLRLRTHSRLWRSFRALNIPAQRQPGGGQEVGAGESGGRWAHAVAAGRPSSRAGWAQDASGSPAGLSHPRLPPTDAPLKSLHSVLSPP